MAHFHRTIRTERAGTTERVQDLSLTNGTSRVSLQVRDYRNPLTFVALSPEDARALAVALLVGAYNVNNGLHANSGEAINYDDFECARAVLAEGETE